MSPSVSASVDTAGARDQPRLPRASSEAREIVDLGPQAIGTDPAEAWE
jgi:hypothetical protein